VLGDAPSVTLLCLLRIHAPDGKHCHAGQMCWPEMRNRLEELNWPDPALSLHQAERRTVDSAMFVAQRKCG
jgi:hypothetical protein